MTAMSIALLPSRSGWDFPRAAAGLEPVLDLTDALRIPRAAVFAGVRLPVDGRDPDAMMTARQELDVMANVARELTRRGVPAVELGRRYHLTTFGVLGFAMQSAPTFGAAMELGLRFLDLSHSFATPSVTVDERGVRVTVRRPVDVPDEVGRFLAERDLTAIAQLVREALPGAESGLGAELGGEPPADLRPYRALFGVEPRWGSAADVLVLDPALLDAPLPQASTATHAWCARVCADLAAARRGDAGLDQVRVLVSQLLPSGATMKDVADALGTSERTLRRRLAESGVTYREVLEDVRRSAAPGLLESGLSTDDVAARLGYADAAGFSHAFRRWFGVGPGARRR
jgi:AraC-like DNA-binding protein